MANILELMPEIMGEEQMYISSLFKSMDANKLCSFTNVYRTRRRDPQTILLVTLAGFVGIAGIQDF